MGRVLERKKLIWYSNIQNAEQTRGADGVKIAVLRKGRAESTLIRVATHAWLGADEISKSEIIKIQIWYEVLEYGIYQNNHKRDSIIFNFNPTTKHKLI